MARITLILTVLTTIIGLLGGFRFILTEWKKLRIRRHLTLMVMIILCPSFALAEDLYVGQSAVGSDTGANCANQHSAVWFNTAGNWGGGAGEIDQGDTVHLCGTITSTLTVQLSGSSGSPITIVWEAGAKLSQAVCPTTGCFDTNSKTFLVINGGTDGIIEATANGTGRANQTASVGLYAIGCTNCEIKNLHINDIYVHSGTACDLVTGADSANAIKWTGSNSSVHDNVIHDAGWSLYLVNPVANTNIQVYNNDVYNNDHSFTVGIDNASTTSGVKIYNNHFHDYSNWDTTLNCYHHDGIHAYSNASTEILTDVDIYNNLFDGACGANFTSQIFYEGAGPGTSTWQRARIFNNVLSCSSGTDTFSIFYVQSGNNYEVYNNTIIGRTAGSTCFGAGGVTNLKFKNNALTTCGLVWLANYGPVTISDWNYNTYGAKGSVPWFWNGVTSTSDFATWKAACSCDANSTDNVSIGLDSDGVPQAGSAVIDAGTDLSSLGITALNTDLNGGVRPAGASWDTGAYEYDSSPGPPGSTPDSIFLFISSLAGVVHLASIGYGALSYGTILYRRFAQWHWELTVRRWLAERPVMLEAPHIQMSCTNGIYQTVNHG